MRRLTVLAAILCLLPSVLLAQPAVFKMEQGSPTVIVPVQPTYTLKISAASGLTLSNLTTNGGLLKTNGSGVISQTGAGTSTTVLHGGTSPAYSAVSLTADVSGILPTANGGTGIAYFTAAGPTTARVYTFPDAAATILYSGGALGTPSSGVATNLTGTASGLTAGNVTTNANLTGPITSVGNATSIASQTGTGTKFVVDTSPTLVTPILGVASATSLACPTFTTSSGAMGFTPASGSGFNITLATTGDFAVGTDLYVDTSASKTGIGTNAPAERLHVLGTGTTYQRFETSGSANPAGSYGLTPTTELDSTSFGGYNITRFGVSTVGYNGLIGVAGGLLLGTYGNTDLVIGTNNTERIRVKNNGYAGSGTSSPVTIWNVEGASVSPASLTLSNLYTSSPFAVTQSTTHYGVYIGADASSGNAWIQVDNAGAAYDLLLNPLGGNVVVGHTGTALAKIESRATSGAQFVASYDASNSSSFTTSSGGNLTINVTGSRITLGDTLNIPTATPASAGAAGTAGDIAWDSSYIYICVGSSSWKRAAIAAW